MLPYSSKLKPFYFIKEVKNSEEPTYNLYMINRRQAGKLNVGYNWHNGKQTKFSPLFLKSYNSLEEAQSALKLITKTGSLSSL